MSDFEDKLHAILSDPEELERIGRLASALMGGGAGRSELGALADALSPWLRPERLSRLRRALRLAGMLRVAGTVLGEEASERV